MIEIMNEIDEFSRSQVTVFIDLLGDLSSSLVFFGCIDFGTIKASWRL